MEFLTSERRKFKQAAKEHRLLKEDKGMPYEEILL